MHRKRLSSALTSAALLVFALALWQGSSLRAQDSNYILWAEADQASCNAGDQIRVRILLEALPGAKPVIGWRFGVCHDPERFRLAGAVVGKDGQVCAGGDPAFTQILTGPGGFIETVLLPPPDIDCPLEPGCPYELAEATYVCLQDTPDLAGQICLCDQVPGRNENATVVVLVEENNEIVPIDPTRECRPRECGGDEPPPQRRGCDCTGDDFWLTFPGNFVPEPAMAKDLRLLIASKPGASGQIAASGFVQNFTVAPNGVTEVIVPHALELGRESDVITDRGIHVVADSPVQIHGLNRVRYAVDGFLALPTGVLGTQYLVLGYKNVYAGAGEALNGTQFAIVATEDDTTVEITPSVDTGPHSAGVPYTLSLQRGETYQLANHDDAFADLSGTLIESSDPIAVFGGHFCAMVPDDTMLFCNNNVEQIPPTNLWGRQFLSMPLKTRTGGETFRMLAQADNTTIQVNGAPVATINRGEIHELEQASPAGLFIAANQPILVAQHARSSMDDGVLDSDASMMLLQPLAQFQDEYLIKTPDERFESSNWVNIVVPSGAAGSVQLDGGPVGGFGAPIGGTGFVGAAVQLTKGSPHVLTASTGFGAQFYGFDRFDAYSYPGCTTYERRSSATTTVTRSIEDDPCDAEPARVTLTAAGQGDGGPVTVTDTFPSCAKIVEPGQGRVEGSSITFTINPGRAAGYSLDVDECCQDPNPDLPPPNIQGATDGPCPDPVQGDSDLECCDEKCDTHCLGIDVITEGNKVEVFASGFDESGDPLFYTFTADNGNDPPIVAGPKAESSHALTLPPGKWTISVLVSDDSDCDPPADDAVCSVLVTIEQQGTRPFTRGDANGDLNRDLSDAVFTLNHLFQGGPGHLCLAGADTNKDGGVDLSDPIFLLNFLFLGRQAPPGPDDCESSPDESDVRLGCEESRCP